MLAGTFQVVNNGPGEQADPHIDCNLVSYTYADGQGSLHVRYYDFTTNTDHAIPGDGVNGLSHVYGTRIAFTEATPSGPVVVIFDTATETRSVVPGFWHGNSALGGNLVAFEDRTLTTDPTGSEIVIYDLSTETFTRLTNDSLFDRNPAVSPTANAVVWEKCQHNGSPCDIYASMQTSPGAFTTRALTGSAGDDRGADTNGQIAVYTSTRGGETDIYFQPVAGGAEMQLSIPGIQYNVNIASNVICFVSQVGTQYDIFVYDLSTGNLYRVTDTPAIETWSDITVCNGTARIVYSAPNSNGDYDLFAFTFQLPSSTENQIEDLIELVESFDLPDGIENSLMSKLQDALAAIAASDTATACDSLTAFINECQAQSGKKLTSDQANQLINTASQIKTDLGCQ